MLCHKEEEMAPQGVAFLLLLGVAAADRVVDGERDAVGLGTGVHARDGSSTPLKMVPSGAMRTTSTALRAGRTRKRRERVVVYTVHACAPPACASTRPARE